MERAINTKFYEFSQNNSGGYFDVDENVCARVIIEAINSNHALSIFEPMIENQSPSCSCCGDRWSTYEPDEIREAEINKHGGTIETYAQYMANEYGHWTTPDVRIHYLDKTIGEFNKQPKP